MNEMANYKIVQISDTHLTVDGAKPANHQLIDPYEKLQSVFDDIYVTNVDPDLIVITGDLVHNGDEDSYRHFHHIVQQEEERLMTPIEVILGNHDRTDQFYEGYLGKPSLPRYYFDVESNDWHLYFLDTKCGDIEHGYLDHAQLEWLSDRLSHSEKPGLIFMHHPLLGAPVKQMKYSILQNGDELKRVISGTDVRAIFSGHVHFANTYLQNGVLNVVADSTAYHINCANPHQHFVVDGTSYNIVHLDGDEIGVEQRLLRLGTKTINTFKIPNTNFVDPKLMKRQMENAMG